ncbi:MAG: CoA transferase [Chloroflexota bacterium]|nr:CoA transferase [Chloroflexota bacterium]
MKKVFEGIRVLDVSQFLSGPICAQHLADMGAEVIKIEPPYGEQLRQFVSFIPHEDKLMSLMNRNKKGLTLNMRTEKGREIFKDLIKKSDVLVENFTLGVMERMGLDYPVLKEINPRLVHVSIKGFGLYGPNSSHTAFDIIAQATGGILWANRQPDKVPGIFMGDMVSGGYAALGACMALFHRERTGEGQLVDVSMQDVMYMHNFPAAERRAEGDSRDVIEKALGTTFDGIMTDPERCSPLWNSYATKDGYVVIAAGMVERHWKSLAEIIGGKALVEDVRFNNPLKRLIEADPLRQILRDWMKERTSAEVIDILSKESIPCGIVQDADMVNRDPQLEARGMLTSVPHPVYGKVDVPGIPIQFSETPGRLDAPCPELGQHNDEILSEVLGYSPEERYKLKGDGII